MLKLQQLSLINGKDTRKFALSSYADPVHHVGRSQVEPPISVRGEAQRAEAGVQRAESWDGVGEGSQPPPHQEPRPLKGFLAFCRR